MTELIFTAGRKTPKFERFRANFVRLLDLPAEVQAHVSRGTLSMGQARALLAVPDADGRLRLAEQAIRERWSVRQVESAAQAWKDLVSDEALRDRHATQRCRAMGRGPAAPRH